MRGNLGILTAGGDSPGLNPAIRAVAVMVAARGNEAVPVPLEEIAGRRKSVPLDHPWIVSARNLGVGLGD